ncbi:MAG: DNA replication initiation control protein YabA [Synechococcaceae cyanobacterium SM2_3_1]|nr:DNA replication initiation control protein YabA [Synechococcaceae cyanobacterium SM2_3_1]
MPYETDVLTSMLPDTSPGRRAYPEPRSLRPRDMREQMPPTTIPAAVYQRLVGELKGARQHISQLTQENQALETANQQLRQEVENLTDQLQSSMSQTLDRLRRLSQTTSASKNAAAVPTTSSATPVAEPPTLDQTYSFLERLKQRQSNGLGRQAEPLAGSQSALIPPQQRLLSSPLGGIPMPL